MEGRTLLCSVMMTIENGGRYDQSDVSRQSTDDGGGR